MKDIKEIKKVIEFLEGVSIRAKRKGDAKASLCALSNAHILRWVIGEEVKGHSFSDMLARIENHERHNRQ